MKRLTFLLEKSAAYASILQMEMEKSKLAPKTFAILTKGRGENAKGRKAKRMRVDDSRSDDENGGSPKRPKRESSSETGRRLKQPALVTGAKLKDYQLEGVEWMISLDRNGISGILGEIVSSSSPTLYLCYFSPSLLADEMGLGKVKYQIVACICALLISLADASNNRI